jgi:RimJ/RimL family protein N-acetyltransferase
MAAVFIPVADARPSDAAWPTMSWPPPERLTGTIVELSACVPDRDAEPLFQALSHADVWRHLPARPRSAEQYAATLAQRLSEGRSVWVVRLLQPHAGLPSGAVVGTTSFLEVGVQDARLEIGATAYAPCVWASGVNPDTKLQLLRCAFETLAVGRVELKTDARNVRSQRAIARLGARYEGTLRRHRRRVDGTVRDSVLFSIIAEEWVSVKESLLARVSSAVELRQQR